MLSYLSVKGRTERPMPEPTPYDPSGPRYTTEPFPAYRHLPGATPHPRRHPHGHAFGQQERTAEPFDPARWRSSPCYLYGVDLYNFAYFWEAHEVWEAAWKTVEAGALPALFLQGLIQISAALLKREQRIRDGMESLGRRGFTRLQSVGSVSPAYCGIDLDEYLRRIEEIFNAGLATGWPADPRILLTQGKTAEAAS